MYVELIRKLITIFMFLSVFFFIVISFIFENYNKLSLLSYSINISLIIWFLFTKWIWKWNIFYSWLVPFPKLAGKWNVEIISVDINGEKTNYKGTFDIFQTFFNIVFSFNSEYGSSKSIVSNFNIDREKDIKEIYFVYLNEPKNSTDRNITKHYGSTKLLFKDENLNILEGSYFTDGQRKGDIKLTRIIE